MNCLERVRTKKNKVLILLLFAVLACFVYGCSKEISEQEVISITQNFVNANVKFYAANETGTGVVPKVAISLVDTKKINDEWYVRLYIQSNATGEAKKSGLVVVVDAKTGEVKKEKLSSFIAE